MKTFKKILIGMAVAASLIFVNGIYYVFWGQEKSVKKLDQGKELNLYECCSIYSMHCAVWMFGWPVAPEAALAAFLMHFPHGDIIIPSMIDFYAANGFSTEVKYKASDYSTLSLKQLRYPLILNSSNTYFEFGGDYSLCVISIKYTDAVHKIWKIPCNTILFKYLQNKHILFPYNMGFFYIYV